MGRTGFVAVMGVAAFPPAQLRPTALLLNVLAAGYATLRLRGNASMDTRMFAILTAFSVGGAFLGGWSSLVNGPTS